jgi:hypothetical protein
LVRIRAVKLDLILVNNTGLVVSLGGGALINPENLSLTTSSSSSNNSPLSSSTANPTESDIKIEIIRYGNHCRVVGIS